MKIKYQYVSEELKKRMIEYRRDFHRYPEIGWTEYRTSAVIADRLKALGFEVYMGESVCDGESRMGLPEKDMLARCEDSALREGGSIEYMEQMQGGNTGVIGIIRGRLGTKKTALRFDMDALPIQEIVSEKNSSYISLHENVMHACGHDGHMAVGLGLAEILVRNILNIDGEIRLIFQPAEEGCRGARAVVNKGWLDDIDEFYGGHIGIGCRKTGMIAACTKGFLASTKMNVYFHGKAAHAANAPEQGRNALLAAAQFTVNAYEALKNTPEDVRMNVGRFVSGTGRNIIADEAYLEVETRGADETSNRYMQKQIIQIAETAAAMHRVKWEMDIVGDVGTGQSDLELIHSAQKCAVSMGIGDWYVEDGIFNASEDVTGMMCRVQEKGGKAAYFMFGSELSAEHHQNNFDFDEEVLFIMTEFYAKVLVKNVNSPYPVQRI